MSGPALSKASLLVYSVRVLNGQRYLNVRAIDSVFATGCTFSRTLWLFWHHTTSNNKQPIQISNQICLIKRRRKKRIIYFFSLLGNWLYSYCDKTDFPHASACGDYLLLLLLRFSFDRNVLLIIFFVVSSEPVLLNSAYSLGFIFWGWSSWCQ